MTFSALANIAAAVVILAVAAWLLWDEWRYPAPDPKRPGLLLRSGTILAMAVLSVVSALGSLFPVEGPEREAVRFLAGILRGAILSLMLGLLWHRHQEREGGTR